MADEWDKIGDAWGGGKNKENENGLKYHGVTSSVWGNINYRRKFGIQMDYSGLVHREEWESTEKCGHCNLLYRL